MTAPALPGAAPDPAPGRNDPARLPPEVDDAILAAMKAATDFGVDGMLAHLQRAQDAVNALRTAIARALGGDGEPVAWAMCFVPFGHDDTAAKPKLLFDTKDRAEDVARRQSAFGVGTGARFIVRPMTWADAPSRPAATGDTTDDAVRAAHRAEVERAVREAVEQERAACAFASIDVIRAVMRELDEFSKGEVAENGYIDEGDDDGTGHTPFRNGWTLYGFARNEMCGVLTKVPAAIRARGVAKPRTGSEAPSASDEGAKS